jgi:hypothetical protein
MLIDDFAGRDFISKLGTRWRAVSDQVMGGISEASVAYDTVEGRPCFRLTGDVRLENDGGSRAAMARDIRFTSALRIMSVPGSPTALISPQVRHGRRSLSSLRLLRPIGWMRRWISRGFAGSAWSLLDERFVLTSRFASLNSIARLAVTSAS